MTRWEDWIGDHDDGDDPHRASCPPLYQTATFRQRGAGLDGTFDYSRSGNPTRQLLEKRISRIEGGAGAAAFSSGMAAIAALLRAGGRGGRVVVGDDLYGGSFRLLQRMHDDGEIELVSAPLHLPGAAERAFTRGVTLGLIETPSNPRLRIIDVAATARAAHAVGARLAVDATLLTPCRISPLRLGADFVVHSATKGLAGHADLSAGLVVSAWAEDHEAVAWRQNAEGAALAPFDAWLLLRGMKTLPLRLDRQEANAGRLAARLAERSDLRDVRHPSLLVGEEGERHRRQASGDGVVISFRTKDGSTARRFLGRLEAFDLTVSFGSLRSTASLPRSMSHASLPRSRRDEGPPDDLVRLSIGIEDPEALWRDLERALG